MVKFSENLRILREQHNLKQSELAEKLNTTQRRISYFESGTTEPDLDTLCKLADFFDVSVDYLLGRTDY